ncbi:MAG: leucine-rich repeat domain-containing protein [Prevotella sp.]|nr:leucine-rich repeat domain-containing protein [Prevotella sp.]
MTSAKIPNSVKSIGYAAFSGCKNLTSITLGNNLQKINEYAFWNCSSLTDVTSFIHEPFEISITTFYNKNEETGIIQFTPATLYVPQGTKEKYAAISAWNNFSRIIELGQEQDAIEVESYDHAVEKERYSYGGQRIVNQQKGLNIIRMTDGSVRKEIAK